MISLCRLNVSSLRGKNLAFHEPSAYSARFRILVYYSYYSFLFPPLPITLRRIALRVLIKHRETIKIQPLFTGQMNNRRPFSCRMQRTVRM